ncbi:hypothetical protein L1049_016793 [Liquidambar formosana]|uniref:Transposase, Ptta/En/Spm, plant n=1 Tax=Liquidambar formosana TaxID=63359 RepID=A0AAP0X7R6_LIQFO
MEKFGELWRGAKYRVKRDYHVDTVPLDLQYQYGPSYLDLTQWKNLVDHWRKSDTMAKAKKNHDNRILKKVNHRAGRKAFARIEHDEAMKNGGIKPYKMTMFMILYKPKGTKPMDSPTKKLVGAMEVHLTQILEGTVVQNAQDQAFKAVVGEGGHGRTPLIGTHARETVARKYRDAAMKEALREANESCQIADENAKRAEEFAQSTREEMSLMAESTRRRMAVIEEELHYMRREREGGTYQSFTSLLVDHPQPPNVPQTQNQPQPYYVPMPQSEHPFQTEHQPQAHLHPTH